MAAVPQKRAFSRNFLAAQHIAMLNFISKLFRSAAILQRNAKRREERNSLPLCRRGSTINFHGFVRFVCGFFPFSRDQWPQEEVDENGLENMRMRLQHLANNLQLPTN